MTSKHIIERRKPYSKLCGTRDPDDPDDDSDLAPPPKLSARDQHFFGSFAALGLKPYRLHVGIAYRPGCKECVGVSCPSDCKATGASKALQPALQGHRAKILLNCEVERLEANELQVTSLVARMAGRELSIRARIFILAAGALATPILLLRSTSPAWPAGLGNNNGLVGRGLMFHCSDFILVFPKDG